jgi:hypothetical protein
MYIEIRHEISNNTGAVTMLSVRLKFPVTVFHMRAPMAVERCVQSSTDLVRVFKCYVFDRGLI